LRIQPPLTITPEQIGYFLEALESTCHELQFLNQTVDSIIRKSIGTHHAETPEQHPLMPSEPRP
ncbi:MAG: hypothetical protein ACRELF_12855, partial [Gemmataceae bacterium]